MARRRVQARVASRPLHTIGGALCGVSRLELDGDVDALQKQLDAEFEELEEKANAFIARVNDEREKVEQKADQAAQALAGLKGSVETAQGQLEAEMDGAQAELKGFADAVAPLDDDVEALVANAAGRPQGRGSEGRSSSIIASCQDFRPFRRPSMHSPGAK